MVSQYNKNMKQQIQVKQDYVKLKQIKIPLSLCDIGAII